MPDYLPFILFAVIAVSAWSITTYNRFVKFINMIEEGWSIIDVALKQRANLIPKLTATVSDYVEHESSTLTQVTSQRVESHDRQQRSQEETEVSRSLGQLLAVAENYPDLKASENFLHLQQNLSDLENKVADTRNTFNARVRKLNTLVQQFPSNLIAKQFGFKKEQYLNLELATERSVPGAIQD